MRVYINNFNLDILNDISDLFKEYLSNSERYIKLYTNEGIYHVEGKNIYFLDAHDKEIKIFEKYYNHFTLIYDPSFFYKQICTSIHGDTHLSLQTKKHTYQINPSSEIKMIIEYISNNDGKFIPNDIYFEIEKDIDINDLFIKKEINDFLSVLN